MRGHLGLDLEMLRRRGERFHQPPRHHAVSGEAIRESGPELRIDEPGGQGVSKPVPAPVRVRSVRDPRADDHVEVAGGEPLDHGRRGGRLVRAVAVHQDVDVGLDVGEHPADDVPLAGGGLVAHLGAGGEGGVRRAVGGAVVVDAAARVRQRFPERPDHAGDRLLFVAAGDEHRDPHCRRPPPIVSMTGKNILRRRTISPLSPRPATRLIPRGRTGDAGSDVP